MAAGFSRADSAKHPLFEQLLLKLEDHFDEDQNSLALVQKIENKKKELKEAKRSYLRKKALHDALKEVSRKEMENEGTSSVSNEVQRSAMLAECTGMLQVTPAQTMLGLTPELLGGMDVLGQRRADSEQLVRAAVIPCIEEHLQLLCQFVVQQKDYKPSQQQEPRDGSQSTEKQKKREKLLRAKAGQLAQCVQENVASLEERQKSLKKLQAEQKCSREEYVKDLCEALALLESLVVECRTANASNHSHSSQALLQARHRALALKFSVLHYQVLIDTYTRENMAAFTAVTQELDRMSSGVSQQLSQCSAHLQSYQCMGEEFVQLAAGYSQLLAATENERWALKEMERMAGL